MVSHTEAHRAKEAIQTQVITIPPRPGRLKNEVPPQSSTRPCGKEPRTRTQNSNMNWNQETSIAEKEYDIDSTATIVTTDFAPTIIKAVK